MVKVSDYIAKYLAQYGVHHVFMVTGGGAMHLNDAVGREERLQYICHHHEQGCAIAAEGLFKGIGKAWSCCRYKWAWWHQCDDRCYWTMAGFSACALSFRAGEV